MPKVKRLISVSDLICDALLRLVESEQKPYNEITIQEIVDEAGVCRNSFYRNYSSVEDIFNKRFNQICSEPEDESTRILRDVSLPEYDYYDVFRIVCEKYKKHKRFFQCYYKANPKAYFDTVISRVITSNTTREVGTLSHEEYYFFACRAWIGMGIATEWLCRDCDISVDELTNIISKFGIK